MIKHKKKIIAGSVFVFIFAIVIVLLSFCFSKLSPF